MMNHCSKPSFKSRKYTVEHTALISMLFVCVLLFLTSLCVTGQNDSNDKESGKKGTHKELITLFSSDDLLEVSLYFDLAKFLRKNPREGKFDASMTLHFSSTDSLNRKVSLKYRGINRLERCPFPPIMINFRKSEYLGPDSVKVKKLKLVTHCDNGSSYEEYVLREYLVYKLFNALTDTSFRVRLLKINYIDSQKKRRTISKYAFFIEPVEILAARTNTNIVKSPALKREDIEPVSMDRLAIFNYMIANWDWSIAGQHNVVVLAPKEYEAASQGIAIPYDFDLTGVVNADFAIPPPGKGIQTVRDRLFLGSCRSNEVFRKDLMSFSDKKEDFYRLVNEFPYLNQRDKRDIIMFLGQFLDLLEKPRSFDYLINTFRRNCK